MDTKTDSSKKNLVIGILAFAILMGLFFYFRSPKFNLPANNQNIPSSAFSAPPLSKEYILESNATQIIEQNKNNPRNPFEITKFTTTKSQSELKKYYLQKLTADGWTIVNQIQGTNSFIIVASDFKQNLNLNIIISSNSAPDGSAISNTVTLIYRRLR